MFSAIDCGQSLQASLTYLGFQLELSLISLWTQSVKALQMASNNQVHLLLQHTAAKAFLMKANREIRQKQ